MQRRSFNPIVRSEQPAIPERPPSSLSLLSETSTVRPLATVRPKLLSTTSLSNGRQTVVPARLTATSSASQKGPPSPSLRRRHLPSLSLTLLPGMLTSTPPRTATGREPVAIPAAGPASRPFTSVGHASGSSINGTPPQLTPSGSGYFHSGNASFASALGASPGALSNRSNRSNGSSGQGQIGRRVSLSDLRIPPRISNAQAKIGQDLKRVKEFKDGVEGEFLNAS